MLKKVIAGGIDGFELGLNEINIDKWFMAGDVNN